MSVFCKRTDDLEGLYRRGLKAVFERDLIPVFPPWWVDTSERPRPPAFCYDRYALLAPPPPADLRPAWHFWHPRCVRCWRRFKPEDWWASFVSAKHCVCKTCQAEEQLLDFWDAWVTDWQLKHFVGDADAEERVVDAARILYLHRHLEAVQEALARQTEEAGP